MTVPVFKIDNRYQIIALQGKCQAEKSAGGVQIKEKSAGETAFERAKFFLKGKRNFGLALKIFYKCKRNCFCTMKIFSKCKCNTSGASKKFYKCKCKQMGLQKFF